MVWLLEAFDDVMVTSNDLSLISWRWMLDDQIERIIELRQNQSSSNEDFLKLMQNLPPELKVTGLSH